MRTPFLNLISLEPLVCLSTVSACLCSSMSVAAEYLAKGYTLSDQILQRAIDLDSAFLNPSSKLVLTHIADKQGISKRFLSYFHSIDSSLGSRALGPDKTISGKVQETLQAATQQAKTVDEQRGITKTAHDVNCFLPFLFNLD